MVERSQLCRLVIPLQRINARCAREMLRASRHFVSTPHAPPSSQILGDKRIKVLVDSDAKVENGMPNAVMNAEGRGAVGGLVDWDRGPCEGDRVLALLLQRRDACVVVSPLCAAGALGRDLPMRSIHEADLLEDRVRGVGVLWGHIVAAGSKLAEPLRA